jgi:hypothetical protein
MMWTRCWWSVIGNIPLAGLTAETAIAGTVTVAVPESAVLVTEVAVIETDRSLAGGAGAVQVTDPLFPLEVVGDTDRSWP